MDSAININLVPKDEIKVFYGTEAHIDNKASVLFIKSGQAEIQNYVDNVSKPEISNYVETEAKPLVTQIVNEIAEPTVAEYIETTVKPEIDDYTDSLKPDLEAYATQANASAIASAASAAASFTSANNAKTSETNAKTYENNALSSKNAAASSATFASNYANNSKIWAEGTDAQVQALGGTHSSKGWAEEMDVNNFVHKTGNEMIYGYKTFRNDNSATRVFIQGYLGLSENPAISGGQAQLEFHDKNGEWEGIVGVERYTNGQRLLKFQLKDQDGAQNRIELVRDQNGVWYATCPTPSSVSDNNTKIATTAWVHSFFNLVYPIGSLYFSTASTCPLQSLGIGTWNKVGTSLTLNVDTNVPVKGNGQALGLIGEGNVVKYLYSGGVQPGVDRGGLLIPSSTGGAAGTFVGTESIYKGGTLVGISTNTSNSGVVGTLTRTQITVNVFQRTA